MQNIPIQAVAEAEETHRHKIWFLIAIMYFIVDYVRPQDILTFLGPLRPGMITISLLAAYVVLSGEISLSWSRQTKLICMFILLLFIHVPFAKNNYLALATGLTMLKFLPFILSVIILVDSIGRLRRFVVISVIIMAYISFYSIMHAGKGSGGWFHDENEISLYINAMLPFVAHLYYYERAKIKKLLYAGLFVMGLATIIISFSRGGLVGLIAMLVVVWLMSRQKIRIFFIMCVAAFVFFTYTSQEYREEMSTITDTKSGTIHGRIITWEAASDMFFDNPLGVGGNNFQIRFQEYQSEEFNRGMWGRVAHSLWFTLIPELGIPGIIIYFMLMWINFKELLFLMKLKHEDNPALLYIYTLSLAFLVSGAGFFASATGLSVLYYPHFWYLTALLVATRKIAETFLSSDVEDENGRPNENAIFLTQ